MKARFWRGLALAIKETYRRIRRRHILEVI